MGLMAAVVGVAGSLGLGAEGANAALKYYRAWNLMERDLQLGLLSDDDEFRVSEDGARRLVEAQDTVEQLLEASRGGDADWDIAYEEGPGALLPHLGLMRASARVIGADALRCEESGDHAGAVQRIAALYRMSGDVSHDRILISSLVGMAIGNEANKLANHFLDSGVIDADDAAVLLAATRELGSGDRFGLRDAIVGEWRMIAEFLLARAPEEGAGKWLIEIMQMKDDDALTKKVAAMDKSALMRELGGWSAFYSDMLGAWDAGDRARMDAAVERLRDGEYGTLTVVMSASLTRAFDSNQRSKEDFRALIERLEEIGG
ncbi:MAG: hypothetical protein R3B67_02555 [Phycisphaerales bacterium]